MPERLRKPHVPDPGDNALIDERLADEPVRVGRSETPDYRLHLRRLGEEVRAQALRRALVQREHRAVPLGGLPLPASQHQPRKAMPASRAAFDAPAATHPQMAANDDRAVEAQEEVLTDRLDVLEHPSVDDTRHAGREPAWMWAFGRDATAYKHLQTGGSTMKRISFRHMAQGARKASRSGAISTDG